VAIILGIETSTAACSIALYRDGVVEADHRIIPRQHNQHVLAMIDTLLARAGIAPAMLDAVAFGCGPGSFTGLRIAAGVAQGIALGADIPLVPVSTLAVLAATALSEYGSAPGVICALPSRTGELYLGVYAATDGAPVAIVPDASLRQPDVDLPPSVTTAWLFAGEAVSLLAPALQRRGFAEPPAAVVLHPHARALVWLAEVSFARDGGVDAAAAVPVYLQGELPWRKVPHARPD
jgi:tRNA threonylcarbamoyladenosine biosynthesis protein TsaB